MSRVELDLLEDTSQKSYQDGILSMAEEHGFKYPKSEIYIAVNDKSFSVMTIEQLAELLRNELGRKNILVLMNGETPV
ncbi:MAG: hypothetical protein ACRCTY_02630 [Candidatus Adiutrix sp.]